MARRVLLATALLLVSSIPAAAQSISLTLRDGRVYLQDLGSSNGTWVNGARVKRPTPLKHGDELRLGDDIMTFELVG